MDLLVVNLVSVDLSTRAIGFWLPLLPFFVVGKIPDEIYCLIKTS